MEISECRSCGAPVYWAVTNTGRRMPVDSRPHPDGNLLLVEEKGELRVYVRANDGPRYRPHFATCPHSKEWRR